MPTIQNGGGQPLQPSVPEAASIVIMGASGDLTARKLVPALYSLAREGLLPQGAQIVGYARRPWSHEEFRAQMRAGVLTHARLKPQSEQDWAAFESRLFYVQGDFVEEERYAALDRFLSESAGARGLPDHRLYYLSAPPQSYTDIIRGLGACDMAEEPSGWRRIVIEKPFGHDLESARTLNRHLKSCFSEKQVYRIDHYLGKETVQNILVLRFANAIFEPIWNLKYIDHVQISVAESVGVGSRAGFYDEAGVVRDIFQNHILQVLTLIAMEPPVDFEADAIRDEKVKVLRAVRPIGAGQLASSTVRAQYGPGEVDGQPVPGYRDEDRTPPDSVTPTFAAFRWQIDNWRWQGVPFYVRSGKRLPERVTEVSVHFRRPPHLLFDAMDDEALRANVLCLRIQPDEGISLQFEVKQPGQGVLRRSAALAFDYSEAFGIEEPPEAYERLLLDALLGDATLFARSDEIEQAWSLIDPILQGWETPYAPPLETYAAGSWGPRGADALLTVDGRRWRRF